MTATYRSLMTTAHEIARGIRGEHGSYAEAFAVALTAAWQQLRQAEEQAAEQAAKPQTAVVYVVSGNTYRHREMLRQAGGTWDAGRKVWVLEADRKGRCPRCVLGVRDLNWSREEVALAV